MKEFQKLEMKIYNCQTNHSYRTCHSMVYDYNYPTLGLNRYFHHIYTIQFWTKISLDLKFLQNKKYSQKYLEESHIYDPH